MVNRQTIFKYKTLKGPLHKWPPIIKIILLFSFSVFAFFISPLWLIAGILFAFIIALICRITLREQIIDLKPAFFYTILLYTLSLFSNVYSLLSAHCSLLSAHCSLLSAHCSLLPAHFSLLTVFMPNPEYLKICLRLIMILQFSAIFFRTTNNLEIREVFRFNLIVLFIGFIPEIFEIWSKINISWKARNGKNDITKIKILVFVLVSCCFEKAAVKAKAYESRRR